MTTSPMPAQVAVLRDELHADVSNRLAAAVRRGEVDDRVTIVEALVADVVREYTVSALRRGQPAVADEIREQLRRSLLDAFIGLGDLQPLIDDPDIENIDVNGAENVFVTFAGGKRVRVGPVAFSDEELVDTLRKVAASLGVQERRFDPGLPRLNLRLPGGARLFAVMSVTDRVHVSIRRHRFMQLTLAELAGLGTMPPAMAQLFEAMVAARLNIVVSGGMDTGKTTMVRALCSAIGPHERIITVEDPYELSLNTDPAHPDVVPMQPRDPNIEGSGGIDMVELVRWATRMNPSRVIVGEVRGSEVIPLLNALNQGTDGSMTTIHASSTREAFKKIAGYARQSKEQLPFDVTYQLISGGVHVVVQLGKTTDGARVVTGVREVVDADATQVRSNEIYTPGPNRRAVPASRFSDVTIDKLLDVGFDPTTLGRGW
ncbi:Flp pilus assembly CpaF family ATPase [Micromonospora sp. Llam0]|uniref:CpaF family protein n=1 Tax=Micromonospora sp. Llam0 TaxID=2485143 RepID=UPI000F467C18|nr:ATPase, T2SS/T4P/T4SS family [Micromonospora sp. Llam0]ROO60372.1 Flp pilus assembly CpaF family ATPase [Micromonospora sp. Llam0]